MTRRDLINKVLFGGTTLIVMPSVLESCTKEDLTGDKNGNIGGTGSGSELTVDLNNSSFAVLKSAGGSLVTNGIILANTGSDRFVALASACTHSGCTVGYNSVSNNFPCPCHGSIFSTSGSVINGPAKDPLKSYTVSRSGDILTIK